MDNVTEYLPMDLLMVETAIKMARKWGYTQKGVADDQADILVCTDNFHGRTTTIVGFSSEEDYKTGFGPFTPGFKLLPYGDLEAVKQAMNPNVAAILVEKGIMTQDEIDARIDEIAVREGRLP